MTAMTTPVVELPTTLAEAHALILAMAEERAAIEAENSRIASEIAALTAANGNLAAVNQAADARIAELASTRTPGSLKLSNGSLAAGRSLRSML
jgi:hypothetical protein